MFFSAGLIENLSDSEECLNVKQIKNTLYSALNPEDACDSIMEKAQNIWKDAKHEDDISLVVAKWEGVPGELISKSEDAA